MRVQLSIYWNIVSNYMHQKLFEYKIPLYCIDQAPESSWWWCRCLKLEVVKKMAHRAGWPIGREVTLCKYSNSNFCSNLEEYAKITQSLALRNLRPSVIRFAISYSRDDHPFLVPKDLFYKTGSHRGKDVAILNISQVFRTKIEKNKTDAECMTIACTRIECKLYLMNWRVCDLSLDEMAWVDTFSTFNSKFKKLKHVTTEVSPEDLNNLFDGG